jgi:cardiolipin synthase
MSIATWLLAHHFISLLVALGFASSVLSQRRPTGSAFAWLLIIFVVPYVGIPLYLSFGGRKVSRKGAGKALLEVPGAVKHKTSGVDWLDDGVSAYGAFIEEIQKAQRSIRIITFVLGDDPTGNSLLDALAQKAEQGVQVELLIDDLLRREAPRKELARLRKAGGKVARFMPLLHVPFRGRNNLRNHRKLALFDGERAITGGMNLADEYMGPTESKKRWRDLSLRISGAPVLALDAIFRADWRYATKEILEPQTPGLALAGEIPLELIPSGPDVPEDPLYDALLTALFRAEKRFWVATPYFIPDDSLLRGLAVAARRGVDVRIVVPARSNHHLADLVAAPYLRELAETGVDIERYLPGMLHAKAVLVDDKIAVVGSANFDMRSLFLNYEVALFFTGKAEIDRLEQWFQAMAPHTEKGMPSVGRVRRRVEEVARLVAPLL